MVNQLPITKRFWGKTVSDPMYKASKGYAMCSKDTNFRGEGRYVIVIVAGTAGGSATFADALAAQKATQEVRFFVTHRKEYQVFSIDGETIERANSTGAVVDAVKLQANKARYKFARALAARFHGNAGGSLGQLDAGTTLSGTTGIFRTKSDIIKLESGDQLEFASDDGSAASPAGRRGAPDQLVVSSVDRKSTTGEFVTTADLDTVAGITADDYIFRRGDYAAAITGLGGWLPSSNPSGGESFFGVDRTLLDMQRQSGIRVDPVASSKEETLINAYTEADFAGAEELNTCFVNSLRFGELLRELGSKVQIVNYKVNDRISFQSLQLNGPHGPISIVAERDQPYAVFRIGNIKDVHFRTAGECPKILKRSASGQFLDAYDADAVQGRFGCYGNLFVENPGWWAIGTW
jgi:hypothetical protein